MRVFIGIGLPSEVRDSLEALQMSLKEAGADVKWVAPQNLHVTLHFLGEVTSAECKTAQEILDRVILSEASFAIRLEGLGAFPSVTSPRIIWVGLQEGKEPLSRIAEAIGKECRAAGLRCEDRPFASHVTLGRVRSSRARAALVRRLRETAWNAPSSWRPTSVTLYQSVLSARGARYSVLSEASLR